MPSDGENGFADPISETEIVSGGEGDAAAPKRSFDRSPIKVLKGLEGRPLNQAMKAIEYIDGGRERERRILRACSPQALDFIAANGPEYLTAVQAVSN